MSMEEIDVLKGRLHDLSARSAKDSYLTHTEFLSMSEQAMFYKILKEEHVSYLEGKYGGVSYFLYGGHEEDDRKIIFFLPYYQKKEEVMKEIDDGEIISCLHVYPRNVKFADTLSHRDYLGALMHLGMKREMFGDILTDGTDAYIFVISSMATQVKEELVKVRHTSVRVDVIKPKDCPFEMRFSLENVNVSSIRLDSILAEVFHLSRRDSQVLIASESVFLNGMTCMDNSHTLHENDRVSVKTKGKFIYLGEVSTSRKGRLFVKIKRYC